MLEDSFSVLGWLPDVLFTMLVMVWLAVGLAVGLPVGPVVGPAAAAAAGLVMVVVASAYAPWRREPMENKPSLVHTLREVQIE